MELVYHKLDNNLSPSKAQSEKSYDEETNLKNFHPPKGNQF